MNTKQVLYDALYSQLETKEKEYNDYYTSVTIPKVKEANNIIREYFKNNIFGEYELGMNDEYLNLAGDFVIKIDERIIYFNARGFYNKNNQREESLEIKSDSILLSKEKNEKVYLNIMFDISHKFDEIENLIINNYKIALKRIYSENKIQEDIFTNFKNAVNNLKNEIENDKYNAMRTIGFELKRFKPRYDTCRKEDSNEYEIKEYDKSITLKTGRSKYYDTVGVYGFKIKGKKNNKWVIEVDKSTDGSIIRDYEITELKFNDFISSVYHWENTGHIKHKKDTEASFERYYKHLN